MYDSRFMDKKHEFNDMMSFLVMLNKAYFETNGKELIDNFDDVTRNLEGKIEDYLNLYRPEKLEDDREH